MPNRNDDFDEIPMIVPEKDELAERGRKRNRGNSSSYATAAHMPDARVAGGTTGPVIFLLTFLFLGMCATAGAGYYFYQESEATKGQLLAAQNRLVQVETRLNLTDEAVEQSASGLVERVNFNFGEIDKLWAARNALRTEVEKTTVAVTALQETAKALEAAVSSQGSQLTQASSQITGLQNRLEQINSNFSGMDNLGQQLTVINADLNRVKTAMSSVESGVASRLATAEQDIESINVYRLQINQTLATLQESLNRLQQRVGQ